MTSVEGKGRISLEEWDSDMRPGIDVRGFLLGSEGIPERQTALTCHEFVVPLEEKQERDRDPCGLFTLPLIAFPQRAETQYTGDNSRFAGQQWNAEGRPHRHTPIAEWPPGPLWIGSHVVEKGLPFGNCLRRDAAQRPDH